MHKIEIRYSSVSGNTKSFIEKLQSVSDVPIHALPIGEETDFDIERKPYIAIVPTYLTGGTGTGPNVREEFTWGLRDYIEYGRNQDKLLGIIGSGNRNFNEQYALTAKRYANDFNVPLLYTYELRGTLSDVETTLQILKGLFND